MLTMNSLLYLPFLAAVAVAYYICPPKYQKVLLLLVSLGFYFSFSAAAGVWLILSSLCYYGLGILASGPRGNRTAVFLALLLGVGALAAVKYLKLIFSVFGAVPPFTIAEPLGISFYSFQAMSYVFDVARGKTKAEKNIFLCLLHLSFFPSILSGPISRAGDMLPQYRAHKAFCEDDIRIGGAKFFMGLFKKAVVADGAAKLVNGVYADFGVFTGETLFLAVIGFGIQLYFDFSGYSDMAIGSARILGIRLPENFKAPYFAASYREFWERWHISLTSWFRDYIYIPLGGNRKGLLRRNINIMVVFVVSGLWHGAALSFLVWGVIQGALRLLDELLVPKSRLRPKNLFSHALRSAMVFLLWSLSLVFFRSDGISNAVQYLGHMFGSFTLSGAFTNEIYRIVGGSLGGSAAYIKAFCALLAVSCVLVLALELYTYRSKHELDPVPLLHLPRWARLAAVLFMVSLLLVFGAFGSSNFIYFNF